LNNRTRTRLASSCTSCRASTPCRPTRYLAVNGAGKRVAGSGGKKVGASHTSVSSIRDSRTRFGLGTSAARLGAGTIARPRGHLAVDGTSERIAFNRCDQVRTCNTIVRVGIDHRTGLGLGTSGTRLGARTETRPARDLAVNGADESVASCRRRKDRAHDAPMVHIVQDGTRLGLRTSAAGLGASTVSRPA
jgi:hypothetical protein